MIKFEHDGDREVWNAAFGAAYAIESARAHAAGREPSQDLVQELRNAADAVADAAVYAARLLDEAQA